MLFPPCSVYQTSDTKEREYQPSNSCGKLQLSTRSYYLWKAASITTEIKPDIVATAGGSKYWLVRDRENNGSANHASVEDENLITPAKGRVEEGISGSQKLSLSLQVQQQNKTFKQTNYVLNIPCASRKIGTVSTPKRITNDVITLSGNFITTTEVTVETRPVSSLSPDNNKYKAICYPIYPEMFSKMLGLCTPWDIWPFRTLFVGITVYILVLNQNPVKREKIIFSPHLWICALSWFSYSVKKNYFGTLHTTENPHKWSGFQIVGDTLLPTTSEMLWT